MSGFVGLVGGNRKDSKHVIHEMMNEIIHRGPNSKGVWSDDNVTLGFRSLDVNNKNLNGSQPFTNQEGTIAVVFDGEIYNYKELREELNRKGYVFKSQMDSEVFLYAYKEYGIESFNKIRGKFAFAIWDGTIETLLMGRDFFGIKPLFYTRNTEDKSLIFASEIKAFLKDPLFIKEFNEEALKPYLTFQYSVLDETFFKGVYRLKPGHFSTYKKGEITETRFLRLDFNETNKELDYYVMRINETMVESVNAHKIGDEKVGAFLSGGIDSSYITALLKPEKTFTVGFKSSEKQFNETNLAKDFSDLIGSKNNIKIISGDDFFEALATVQYIMDEPASNLSAVPLYFLSKLAKEHVDVAFSGEGADELFAGYDWYRKSKKEKYYEIVPFFLRRTIKKLASNRPKSKTTAFLIRGGQKIEEKFIGQAKIFGEEEALRILKEPYLKSPSIMEITAGIYDEVKDKSDLCKMQYLDLNLWMPGDILLKADRMGMANSLEIRTPFLDKKVMSLASELPSNMKINDVNTKYALRCAAEKVLPKEWASRKKVGFVVPFKYWIKEEKYYQIIKEVFESEVAGKFFDQKAILDLLEEHYYSQANNARQIYTIYTFLIWYKVFFE